MFNKEIFTNALSLSLKAGQNKANTLQTEDPGVKLHSLFIKYISGSSCLLIITKSFSDAFRELQTSSQ